eukprot:752595-Hanusia_phi.AAC.3
MRSVRRKEAEADHCLGQGAFDLVHPEASDDDGGRDSRGDEELGEAADGSGESLQGWEEGAAGAARGCARPVGTSAAGAGRELKASDVQLVNTTGDKKETIGKVRARICSMGMLTA